MKKGSKKSNLKCGMVAIVGRPNVGKSTLLNKLVDEKVAIVSKVPQTTRNQVRGVYNDDRGQIIFIDTPGLHMNKDSLDKYMNRVAYNTTKDTDCVIHLVDTKDNIGREEEEIVRRLNSLKKVPIILGLNKVDTKGKYISEYISLWEEVKGKDITKVKGLTLLPLSGKKGINIEKLLDILFENLPKGEPMYPTDTVADVPQRMAVADIIREKLFRIMKHEVPHSLAVMVESMKPIRGKTMHIRALIIVERETQKLIVIGKKGLNLKRIGTLARAELEDLLESKVFLEIFVKTNRKWRDNNSLLLEMGYQTI